MGSEWIGFKADNSPTVGHAGEVARTTVASLIGTCINNHRRINAVVAM